jgi:hypothetical protein
MVWFQSTSKKINVLQYKTGKTTLTFTTPQTSESLGARLKSGLNLKAGLKSTLSDDVVRLNLRARTSAVISTMSKSVSFQKQIKTHGIDELLEQKAIISLL